MPSSPGRCSTSSDDGGSTSAAFGTPGEAPSPWLPRALDPVALLLIVVGFASLYAPTYYQLAGTIWASDEQGHGRSSWA